MFGFANTLAFAVILEELGKVFQGLFLPLVDLIRGDAVFSSYLCHALFFTDGFQDDLCLLAGG